MTRLKEFDAYALRMVDSNNKPIEYTVYDCFKNDGKEVLEIVVNVSTNRMHYILKERKVLYEITVNLTVQNLTVVYVCSSSFFDMGCSTTGIGYPINIILEK